MKQYRDKINKFLNYNEYCAQQVANFVNIMPSEFAGNVMEDSKRVKDLFTESTELMMTVTDFFPDHFQTPDMLVRTPFEILTHIIGNIPTGFIVSSSFSKMQHGYFIKAIIGKMTWSNRRQLVSRILNIDIFGIFGLVGSGLSEGLEVATEMATIYP